MLLVRGSRCGKILTTKMLLMWNVGEDIALLPIDSIDDPLRDSC